MKCTLVYPLLFIVLTSRSQLPIPANLTPFAVRPALGDETETFLNDWTVIAKDTSAIMQTSLGIYTKPQTKPAGIHGI